ncbi:hypothetical protein V8C44DRAFT_321766 [Trichoderma aethiopicum]
MSRLRTGKVPRIRHMRVQHVRACMYPSASEAGRKREVRAMLSKAQRVQTRVQAVAGRG